MIFISALLYFKKIYFLCLIKGQESDHNQVQTENQVEHVGHQQINMVQLLTVRHKDRIFRCGTKQFKCLNCVHKELQFSCALFCLEQKYPIVWQGLLALKNETAAVQLHFVCGNKSLGLRSLPVPETGPPLRIVQRMRLETQQLEGVARRMTVSL